MHTVNGRGGAVEKYRGKGERVAGECPRLNGGGCVPLSFRTL